MFNAIGISVFILLISSVCFAQNIEYGKPEELKGIKKIFIDTEANMKSREAIIKEIEKAKLDIEILDSADGTEVVLLFFAGTDDIVTGNNGNVATVKRKAGTGFVFIPKGERQRVLLSFDDVKKSVFEKKPETNFAKAFIKAYKKANE